MMEDDEKELRALALRAPTAELDARVEKLLSVPRAARGSWTQQAGPWQQVGFWQCVAACAVCAAVAFAVGVWLPTRGAGAPVAAAPVEVHYIVQQEQRAYDVFDWTTYPKKMAPASRLRATPTEVKEAI